MSVVFVYNKANTYGIRQDVSLLDRFFKKSGFTPRHSDPLEPPGFCRVAIHFEIPIYSWMPWAEKNVLVVNPEWWEDAWNPYLSRFDTLLFKCNADKDTFVNLHSYTGKSLVLPWTTPVQPSEFTSGKSKVPSFLWLLGASRNKRAAAMHVLPLWKDNWPPLSVYTTSPLDLGEMPNVKVVVQDLPDINIKTFQAYHPFHLIFSQSEALGLSAMEGQAAGAFLVGNALPAYKESFTESAYLIPADLVPLKSGFKDTFSNITQESLEKAVHAAEAANANAQTAAAAVAASKNRYQKFSNSIIKFINSLQLSKKYEPNLSVELPPISIITLLHNRRSFVELAFHNLLITDYPKDKIEWVIVDDSEIPEEQASDKIMKFGRECAPISVSYVPLQTHFSKKLYSTIGTEDNVQTVTKTYTIGEKRNIGVKRSQNDIILFMDDDDHYPAVSFRRRVLMLLGHPWKPDVAVCTTIACYDLVKGTSAVNTPPWSLPLRERISEATLTFKKSFWEASPFPTVNMAEGSGFLEGRESSVLEMAPQQIIVAMSHGNNASSRRIPDSGKPSCFWGFPKEFLVFLHKLVGVDIEDISSTP